MKRLALKGGDARNSRLICYINGVVSTPLTTRYLTVLSISYYNPHSDIIGEYFISDDKVTELKVLKIS